MSWVVCGVVVMIAFIVGLATGGILIAVWAAHQMENEYEDNVHRITERMNREA